MEAGGSEGSANSGTFLRVGDTEPGGSGAGQGKGAELGGVAVGVGFDDGEDGGIGAGGALEQVVVVDEATA